MNEWNNYADMIFVLTGFRYGGPFPRTATLLSWLRPYSDLAFSSLNL